MLAPLSFHSFSPSQQYWATSCSNLTHGNSGCGTWESMSNREVAHVSCGELGCAALCARRSWCTNWFIAADRSLCAVAGPERCAVEKGATLKFFTLDRSCMYSGATMTTTVAPTSCSTLIHGASYCGFRETSVSAFAFGKVKDGAKECATLCAAKRWCTNWFISRDGSCAIAGPETCAIDGNHRFRFFRLDRSCLDGNTNSSLSCDALITVSNAHVNDDATSTTTATTTTTATRLLATLNSNDALGGVNLVVHSDEGAYDMNCFDGKFTWEYCCHPRFGPGGNMACWNSLFTRDFCCGSNAPSQAHANEYMAPSDPNLYDVDLHAEWLPCYSGLLKSNWALGADAPFWTSRGSDIFRKAPKCLNASSGSAFHRGRYLYLAQIVSHVYENGMAVSPDPLSMKLKFGMCVPHECSEIAAGLWFIDVLLYANDQEFPIEPTPPPIQANPMVYPNEVRYTWQSRRGLPISFMMVDSEWKPLDARTCCFLASAALMLIPGLVSVLLSLDAAIQSCCHSADSELIHFRTKRTLLFKVFAKPAVHQNWAIDVLRILLTASVVYDHTNCEVDWVEGPGYWPFHCWIVAPICDGFVVLFVYLTWRSGSDEGVNGEATGGRGWLIGLRRIGAKLITWWSRVGPLLSFCTFSYLAASFAGMHSVAMLQSTRLHMWYERDSHQCAKDIIPSMLFLTQPLLIHAPCPRSIIFETIMLLSLLTQTFRALGCGPRVHSALLVLVVILFGALEYADLLSRWARHFHRIPFYLIPTLVATALCSAIHPHRAFYKLRPVTPMVPVALVAVAIGFMGRNLDRGALTIPFTTLSLGGAPMVVGFVVLLYLAEGARPASASSVGAHACRILAVVGRLSLGVNMCHLYVIHSLNMVARHYNPEMLAPSHLNVFLWWLAIFALSHCAAMFLHVLVEVPWKYLSAAVVQYLLTAKATSS